MIKTRNWWFNLSTSILIKCKFKKDCGQQASSIIRSINVPRHPNDSPLHTARAFRRPFPCSLLQATRVLQYPAQLGLLGVCHCSYGPQWRFAVPPTDVYQMRKDKLPTRNFGTMLMYSFSTPWNFLSYYGYAQQKQIYFQ